jgi:hypothetical protein
MEQSDVKVFKMKKRVKFPFMVKLATLEGKESFRRNKLKSDGCTERKKVEPKLAHPPSCLTCFFLERSTCTDLLPRPLKLRANPMASVHKFPAVKTGHQREFGAGS